MTIKLVSVGCLSMDEITVREERKHCFGGAALYSSLSSSCFVETGIVSIIGSDYPEFFINQLSNLNIDTKGIRKIDGKSARFIISYNDDWDETFEIADFGVNKYLSLKHFPSEYQKAKVMLINSMHPNDQLEWLNLGNSLGMKVGLATNYIFTKQKTLRNKILEMIKAVDFFVCNFREGVSLFNDSDIGNMLCQMNNYTKTPILTNGSKGVYFLVDNNVCFINSVNAKIKDPTGAGDTFIGALLGKSTFSNDLIESVRTAIKTSAIIVSGFGPECLLDVSNRKQLL